MSSRQKPIKSVADRERLEPRHEPYWHDLGSSRWIGIRKTKDGITWKARLYDAATGGRYQETLGDLATVANGERFDKAIELAGEWFTHRGAGGAIDDATVADACDRYVKHLRAAGKTSSAADAEARFAAYVNPPAPAEGAELTPAELERDEANRRFALVKLRKLAPAHVGDWLNRLRERPAAAGPNRGQRRTDATLNRDVTPFRAALNLALEDKLVTTDEAWRRKLVPITGAERRREGAALTGSQRARFVEHCDELLAPFVNVLALMPLRPGVLAACKVRDFRKATKSQPAMLDLGRQQAVSSDKGHDRMIPVSAAAAKVLEAACKDKLPDAWLFTREAGKPWDKDSWKWPVKDAVRAAKLPATCTLYWLRHATITELVSANDMDLVSIAKVAGTSVRMIEKNYAHLRGGATAAGLELLALPGLR